MDKQLEQKRTPIQEMIAQIDDAIKSNKMVKRGPLPNERLIVLKGVKGSLESLLVAEKQLLEDSWDAGSGSAYECVKPDGPCDFDRHTHKSDKETYLAQFNFKS